ncbi:MAG: MbtH family protein [Dongiaceae bacterium]
MNDERPTHLVLVNDEEQYSLWLSHREIPAGWRQVGPRGSRAQCLAYVEEVWTDIMPLSARHQLAARAARGDAAGH